MSDLANNTARFKFRSQLEHFTICAFGTLTRKTDHIIREAVRLHEAEVGRLGARVEALTGALRRAHSCATLREDGTCLGCHVSEALE